MAGMIWIWPNEAPNINWDNQLINRLFFNLISQLNRQEVRCPVFDGLSCWGDVSIWCYLRLQLADCAVRVRACCSKLFGVGGLEPERDPTSSSRTCPTTRRTAALVRLLVCSSARLLPSIRSQRDRHWLHTTKNRPEMKWTLMVMTSSDRMGDRTSTGGGDVSDFSPSLPRTSVSSGPFTAAYPYDVDDSVACSPTPTDRNLNNWSRPARTVYGGVRQFLSRALKEVHFSSTFFPSLRSSSAQPSQSFQSISTLSFLCRGILTESNMDPCRFNQSF